MTSPIKPPGGAPPSRPEVDASPAPATSREPAATSFSDALAGAAGVEPSASASSATGAPSVTGALADELRAGRIGPREAIEQLVARALASPTALALDPAGRQALAAHLRATLVEDPSLAAMVQDLERAR